MTGGDACQATVSRLPVLNRNVSESVLPNGNLRQALDAAAVRGYEEGNLRALRYLKGLSLEVP